MPTPPLRLMQDAVRSPQAEPPIEHCKNALQLVRVAICFGVPMHANDGPAIVVGLDVLAAIQARLEAAIERLENPELAP